MLWGVLASSHLPSCRWLVVTVCEAFFVGVNWSDGFVLLSRPDHIFILCPLLCHHFIGVIHFSGLVDDDNTVSRASPEG